MFDEFLAKIREYEPALREFAVELDSSVGLLNIAMGAGAALLGIVALVLAVNAIRKRISKAKVLAVNAIRKRISKAKQSDDDFDHDAWREWVRAENLPRKLRRAEVIMSEKDVRIGGEYPMHGTLDLAMRLPNGNVVVIDTKTRNYSVAYASDIIQMSVYRYILERQYGEKVWGYGYIRLVTPGRKIKYKKVRLLGGMAIRYLWHNCDLIRRGEFTPDCTCGGRLH